MARADWTDVLSPRQFAFIAGRLPERSQAPAGRLVYSNRELLPGTLLLRR